MRVEIKAILNSVRSPEKKETFTKQDILLQVPVYDTFTGAQVKVENFPAVILNKNIERLQAKTLLGEIVRATCFLSSFKNEKDGNVYWNLSLNCIELEILNPK